MDFKKLKENITSHQREILGVSLVAAAGITLYLWHRRRKSTSSQSTDDPFNPAPSKLTKPKAKTPSVKDKNLSWFSPQPKIPSKPTTPSEKIEDEGRKLGDEAFQDFQKKQYSDAIINYTKALNKVKTDYRFYTNRGLAYLELKDYLNAYNDAQKSIEIESTLKAQFILGQSALALKKYQKAIEAFQAVLIFKGVKPAMVVEAKKKIDKCQRKMAQQLVNHHYQTSETFKNFTNRIGNYKNIPMTLIESVWNEKKRNSQDKSKEGRRRKQDEEETEYIVNQQKETPASRKSILL